MDSQITERANKNKTLRQAVRINSDPATAADERTLPRRDAPSVTLPKGGGALKSIDEKFSVNSSNGTCSLNLSLPLSKSRIEFSPDLTLSYNSGAGNGPFGLGWSISLPHIQRRTDKQLPTYRDATEGDVFVLSGVEDLVPTLVADNSSQWSADMPPQTNGIVVERYRPRMEGAFSLIEKVTAPGDAAFYWKITTKDNTVTLYGRSLATRVVDPTDPSRVFKWLPELSYDDKGNCIEYTYKPENLTQVPVAVYEANRRTGLLTFCNQYLKRVRYGNHSPYVPDPNKPYQPDAPTLDYFFDVVFDYGEHDPNAPTPSDAGSWNCRCDPFSDCRAGFEIRSYRLCKRILFFHSFKELPAPGAAAGSVNPCLVRSVDFSYRYCTFANPPGSLVEADFITQIQRRGYRVNGAGYDSSAFPPVTFAYNELNWNTSVENVTPENLANAPIGIGSEYQWIDLYCEGISGILTEQADAWYYKSNLGDAKFTPAMAVAPKPSLGGLGSTTLLDDLDADGRTHLVIREPGLGGYFELDGPLSPGIDRTPSWRPMQTFPGAVNFALANPNGRLIDLNGDGKPDLLLTEDLLLTWFPSLGTAGYDNPQYAPRACDEEQGPAVVFNDESQTVFIADMNGDGLSDIVRIRNGEICYWPNLGYGRFGAKICMDGAPFFDCVDRFNPSYIQLADVSGTGAADLLYLAPDRFRAWINYGGNAFGPEQQINPFPTTERPNRVAVVDFLGNGTSCLVWSSPLERYSDAPMRYVDLMGGKKPYLLNGYDNDLGKQVQIQYRSSTYYYLLDKAAGNPWRTRLPFPVQCVDTVHTHDQVSDLDFNDEYQYHHGYYDSPEREFRGFGMVEHRDSQTFGRFAPGSGSTLADDSVDQPPVLTKTWYHTGLFVDNDVLLGYLADEYFQNTSIPEHQLPDALIDTSQLGTTYTMSPLERQQAARACKGMVLRQEVYALDGSPLQAVPYSVAEHNCVVRQLQPIGQLYAVFDVHESEAITYHYERNPADPRISHTLNISFDQYGNMLESASVTYGRATPDNTLPAEVMADQARQYITYTKTDYTTDAIGPAPTPCYRLRLKCQQRDYELTGAASPSTGYFTPSSIQTAFSAAVSIDYEDSPSIGMVQARLLKQQRTLFAQNAAPGSFLAFGQLQSLAIEYETYQLVFTSSLLSSLYGTKVTTGMLTEGGYGQGDSYKSDGRFPSTDDAGLWWIPSGTVSYFANPAQMFYLPKQYVDPFGNVTTLSYWSDYSLLISSLQDPLGNVTTVQTFDFTVLQPQAILDINQNISEVRFDRLGLVVGTALRGKGTEADDFTGFNTDLAQADIDNFFADPVTNGPALLKNATSRFVYDFTVIPSFAASISREIHHAIEVAQGVVSPTQYEFEYSNGLGKVVMRKIQADPGKANQGTLQTNGTYSVTTIDTTPNRRWIGNGRTILNNKGNPVLQYEPYFSVPHEYEDAPELVELGVTPVLYYDPLDRLIETDFADGTTSRIEFDPWQETRFDQNDTILSSDWYAARKNGGLGIDEQVAAQRAAVCDNTPDAIHFDSMGRDIYSVADNKFIDQTSGNTTEQFYATRTDLDIEGNTLAIIDARGNQVMQYAYDMSGRKSFQLSMDAGRHWILPDIHGKPLYEWDQKSHQFHTVYDALRRPTNRLVLLTDGVTTVLFDKSEYGSDPTKNQNGQIIKHSDGAGIVTFDLFDFKGNLLSSTRTFTDSTTDLNSTATGPNDDSTPDWTNPATIAMDPRTFTTTHQFDTLNRVTLETAPDGSQIAFQYGFSKLLNNVNVTAAGGTAANFVSQILHDEKGRRSLITYGNGVVTTYTYDPLTFRLDRLQTIRSGGPIADGAVLQDLNYTYDPVGNIMRIKDLAQPTLFFNNTVVSPQGDYIYDSTYRLISATGREHIGQTEEPASPFDETRVGLPLPGDAAAMRNYLQQYTYDSVGNMLAMAHLAGTGSFTNRWTRNFTYDATDNRLASSTVGGLTENYTYDVQGNMTTMPHLPTMSWNFNNQLRRIDLPAGDKVHYTYDASGTRARKLVQLSRGVIEERLYIGDYEVFTATTAGATTLQRTTLHIMDDKQRVAMLDIRTSGRDNAPKRLIRYQYGNQIGSVTLELDNQGQITAYEEYFPFGNTSVQTVNQTIGLVAKRYRYTSKERDDENGLYYHGARYYAPWLVRWISPDPLHLTDVNKSGANEHPQKNPSVQLEPLYVYVKNQPVKFIDPLGLDIAVHPLSQLTAEQFVQAIKTDKRIPAHLSEGFSAVPDGDKGRIHVAQPSEIKVPSAKGKDVQLPKWYLAVEKASEVGKWTITTGEVQLYGKHGRITGGSIKPDLPSDSVGINVGGKFQPLKSGTLIGRDEVPGGITLQQFNPAAAGPLVRADKGDGVLVIGNRPPSTEDTSSALSKTIKEEFGLTTVHEIVHAGLFESGRSFESHHSDKAMQQLDRLRN